MKSFLFASFSALFLLAGCTVERATEQIVATHANGAKKTSLWVYPDGEILKRNEWYTDGIKELEIPYKNNEPHGEFKRWTGYGDVAMIGEYKQGKRHGTWTSYYTANLNSRKKEAVRYYKDDHAIGNWEGWFYNETKAFEEHYSDNGDSIGLWKRWNEDGSLALENSCFVQVESGFFRQYSFKGILEYEYHCRFGKKDGQRLEYYDDGKKLKVRESWADNILNGLRETYSGEGVVLKREFWRNGLRDSLWQWFDADGKKIAETILKEAQVDAVSSGALAGAQVAGSSRTDFGVCGSAVCAESTFVMNDAGEFVLDGTLWFMREGKNLRYEESWEQGDIKVSRSFYPDAAIEDSAGSPAGGFANDAAPANYMTIASEGFWKDGKRHGIWRNWYRSGILRDSLSYVAGERVGEQFSYDSTGKLTIHKTENGKNRPVIMHIPQ